MTPSNSSKFLIKHWLAGLFVGIAYAIIEYLIRINTDDPQLFLPLIIRTTIAASVMILFIGIFDVLTKTHLAKATFLKIVIFRALGYTLIISIFLLITNAIWTSIEENMSIYEGLTDYFSGISYWVNISTILFVIAVLTGVRQINNLHRKSELLNYIIGTYHKPKEIKRIFSFIDLVGSTTIAEKLGHYKYANFLKDYYYDITDALKESRAEIYQYIGDEIVLTWPFEKGLKNNNVIHCFFRMKEIIEKRKEYYLQEYGFYPTFKAGSHGGKITVTWVGEIKKEIIYIGDVVNTAARIQELCKKTDFEYLISENILTGLSEQNGFKSTFVDEVVPRGKEKMIKLYGIVLTK